ncbi:MAG TPA: hypothetical protein VLA22_11870, partial [Gaiellaceae bacterium]|nr:hypothetical protein [Gaiellaceae bacterium]
PGFLERVMRFCVPAGLIAGTAALATYGMARFEESVPLKEARTTATLVLVAVGLWVLVLLARPFNWWKGALVGAMGASVALVLVIDPLRKFYALQLPEIRVLGWATLIAVAAIFLLEVVWRSSRGVQRSTT